MSLSSDGSVTLADLPVPNDVLDGAGTDGRALWSRRLELGLDPSWFGAPAPPANEPLDLWNPALLSYDATLGAGDAELSVARHEGG